MEEALSTRRERPVFIVNRRAGRFRRDGGLLARLEETVRGKGVVLPTNGLEDLVLAAERAVHGSTVVLCGGDGTYLAGVTALVRAAKGAPLPPIVLARGGTVSIVARNWGGRRGRDPIALARRVCDRPESLRVTSRPTLAVTDDGGTTRIGFTFGTGLVARFFDVYEREGASGNRLALGIALRTFRDCFTGGPLAERVLSPLSCRLSANDRPLGADAWSLVVASVLRDVGLHIYVTYRGGEDFSRPHLVASPLAPRALGPQLTRVMLGKALKGEGNFDDLVDSFTVEFPSSDGPYVLDGDMFRAHRVTVRAGPVISIAT
jgi:hypothetical protein